MEEWRDIEGFENIYQISNFGRVKRLQRTVIVFNRFKYCERNLAEKYMSTYVLPKGYQCVKLHHKKHRRSEYIHRLVALAFIPQEESKKEVNHKDGDKHNNHVDNLEWCTRKENIQHAWDTGLNKSTEKQKESVRRTAKLKVSKVVLDESNGVFYDSVKDAAKYNSICYAYMLKKLNGLMYNDTNLIYA